MSTQPWRTLQTENLEIAIRWPNGRVPVSLIVDDPMPGLNPMIDHEPGHPHRKVIPNTVLQRFADVTERWDIRGKFSVVPWPLATGRLDQPSTLPDSARAALPEFLEVVRSRITPRFDITCEFLTHSRAIDLATGRPMAETERQWAGAATAGAFADTFALAAHILGNVGLPMDGVTSPWDSGADNEGNYAHGVALAGARRGDRAPWYFLHQHEDLDVLPRVAFRDEDGLAISVILGTTDPAWHTQYGRGPRADELLDPDGHGRMAELITAGLPVVICTHWQSLYGNGSFGGVQAMDLLGSRLREHFNPTTQWVPLSRHAALGAACATLEADETAPTASAGWGLTLRTPHPFPLAEVELRGRTARGRARLAMPLAWNGTPVLTEPAGEGAVRMQLPLCTGVLA